MDCQKKQLRAQHSELRKVSVFDDIRELQHPRGRADLHHCGTTAPWSQDKGVVRARRVCANGVQFFAVPPRASISTLGMEQRMGCAEDLYSRDQRKVHHLPGNVREWVRLALVYSPPIGASRWIEKPVNDGDHVRHGVIFPYTVYHSEDVTPMETFL